MNRIFRKYFDHDIFRLITRIMLTKNCINQQNVGDSANLNLERVIGILG